MPHKIPENQTS